MSQYINLNIYAEGTANKLLAFYQAIEQDVNRYAKSLDITLENIELSEDEFDDELQTDNEDDEPE